MLAEQTIGELVQKPSLKNKGIRIGGQASTFEGKKSDRKAQIEAEKHRKTYRRAPPLRKTTEAAIKGK